MATQAQILGHLLTTVMELDTEDIKDINNSRYQSYKNCNDLTYDDIDRPRNRHIVSLYAWRELTG